MNVEEPTTAANDQEEKDGTAVEMKVLMTEQEQKSNIIVFRLR